MSTLLIGNSFNDQLVADLVRFDPVERRVGGNISLRLAWLAEPGDVMVLPQAPDPRFLEYLSGFKGIARDSVSVLVPPRGRFGYDVLTRERLMDSEFQERLAEHVNALGVRSVLPYTFDRTIARLCRRLGLHEPMPGFAFLEQGGGDLLNSKSVFRAMAAGVGVPIPAGVVTVVRAEAEEFVRTMFDLGRSVIVKQDFHQGGHGNEILAPVRGVAQIGATVLTVLADSGGIATHLDRRWPVYSNDGRGKVVLEHYVPDSTPIGAEVHIGADDVDVHHIGEMRMTPVFDGVVLPGATITAAQREEFDAAVRTLCGAVRTLGYRGLINIDGIIDGDGQILFNEFNGRLGGTTHLHWLGEAAVGAGYTERRVFVSNNDWQVPSFAEALAQIETAGLAYDRDRATGVVITCDHTRQSGAVEYCVIAPDLAVADEIEAELKRVRSRATLPAVPGETRSS